MQRHTYEPADTHVPEALEQTHAHTHRGELPTHHIQSIFNALLILGDHWMRSENVDTEKKQRMMPDHFTAQPQAAGGLSHQRVKVVTRKRKVWVYLMMSRTQYTCTHVHAYAGEACMPAECTHHLMLCQSWRAVSKTTTGLRFPWRPVHRSWSLNPGRPELSAFSRASCRYNGRMPVPWCQQKKKNN